MAEYEGEERRHCGNHESNTKDLASIRSSFGTIKWVGGGFLTIGLFVIGAYLSALDDSIKSMNTSLQTISVGIATINVNQAVTRTEVEQLKKDVADLQDKVEEIGR